jgi:hypothetical protein
MRLALNKQDDGRAKRETAGAKFFAFSLSALSLSAVDQDHMIGEPGGAKA